MKPGVIWHFLIFSMGLSALDFLFVIVDVMF